MNTADGILLIDNLKTHYTNIEKYLNGVESYFGDITSSPLFELLWQGFDQQVTLTHQLLNIDVESLCWFIYDNQFGANGLAWNAGEDGVKTTLEFLQKAM